MKNCRVGDPDVQNVGRCELGKIISRSYDLFNGSIEAFLGEYAARISALRSELIANINEVIKAEILRASVKVHLYDILIVYYTKDSFYFIAR